MAPLLVARNRATSRLLKPFRKNRKPRHVPRPRDRAKRHYPFVEVEVMMTRAARHEEGSHARSDGGQHGGHTRRRPESVERFPSAMLKTFVFCVSVLGVSAQSGCSNSCQYTSDGDCDDGGAGSEYQQCLACTDCADCGLRAESECLPLDAPPASPAPPPPTGYRCREDLTCNNPSETVSCACWSTCSCLTSGQVCDPIPGRAAPVRDTTLSSSYGCSRGLSCNTRAACMYYPAPPPPPPPSPLPPSPYPPGVNGLASRGLCAVHHQCNPNGDNPEYCAALTVGCTETCRHASDGVCDDGGSGSETSYCSLGSDCADCGARAQCLPCMYEGTRCCL